MSAFPIMVDIVESSSEEEESLESEEEENENLDDDDYNIIANDKDFLKINKNFICKHCMKKGKRNSIVTDVNTHGIASEIMCYCVPKNSTSKYGRCISKIIPQLQLNISDSQKKYLNYYLCLHSGRITCTPSH